MKNFLLSFAMLLTIVSCGGDNGLTPDEPDTPDTPPTEQPDTPPTDEPDTPPTDEPDTPPADEPETPPTDEPETPPVEETIYSATIEFAEQFGFEWSDNTSISLFTSTQNEKFAYDAESEMFKKADASQPSNIATPKVFGVYPYSSKNEVSEDGTVTLTIPMVQAYKAEGVDFAITPMLAVAEAENNTEAEADTDTDAEPKVKELEFEHLFGYVEIPVYALLSDDTQSLAIKRVKLTAANDKPIAGYVSFKTSDVSDGNYSFDFDPALSSSYVTVDCGEGVTAGTSIETATSFHFILPAATYADGLTIEITGDNGRVFKFDIASDVTVARGEVLTLETIELGPDTPPVEETTYSATIEFAEQFGFEWSDNTSISLFTSTQNEQFSYDAASARFKKADASSPSNIATPKVFGVYPYSTKNKVSEDGTVALTIPMAQTYKAEGVDFAITPMLAVAEAENDAVAQELKFEHLFGYVEIPIYAQFSDGTQSLVIKSIKLTAANDEPIAGYVSFKTSDVSDANYSFDFDPALSSSYVTVDCGEGVTVGTTATPFHFILPAATYTDGLAIEITCDNCRVFKFTTPSVTVARGEVSTLEDIKIAIVKGDEYLLNAKFDAYGNATDEGRFKLNIEKKVNSSNEAPYLSAYTNSQFSLNNIVRFSNYPSDAPSTHSYYSVDISDADLQAAMKDGFTVETVAMFPIDIATHWSRLISTESWGIVRQGAGFNTENHPFRAYANAPGTRWDNWGKVMTISHQFKANTYFHIMCVYSPNRPPHNQNSFLVYVNGVYDTQVELNVDELNPGRVLAIGAYPYADGRVFQPWCGDIALARIYDDVLDAETIYKRFKEIKFPSTATAPQRPSAMLDLQVNKEGVLTNNGSLSNIVPTLVTNDAGKAPSVKMLELSTYDKPILAFKHTTNQDKTVTDSYYKITSADSPELFAKLNDGAYTIEAIISTPNAIDRSVPVSTEAFNLIYMPEYNKYNIRTFDESRNILHYDSFFTPTTDKYLHIVYVVDKDGGKIATTFVNGRHDGSNNDTPIVINSLAQISNFTIGCAAASDNGQIPFSYGFDGNVAMVRVYDEALTPMEVKRIYTEDNIKDILAKLDTGVITNPEEPEEPETPEFPALTTLADVQWKNNGEGKPVATDATISIETKYMSAEQNLWISDAPEGYTLNKIAKWCTDETKMTYFIADMTNIRSKMQDGFSIEVIHRDPRTEGDGVSIENNWRALFGGRDFGLWLNKNWTGNGSHGQNAQYRGQYQWDARMWDNNKDETCPRSGIITPNEWHHTVYIYDAANKKLLVYTDGELKVEKTNAVLRNTDQRLPIGARMFSGSDTTKFTWGGEMALFKIYDDAVTAGQVAAMYGNRKPEIKILSR